MSTMNKISASKILELGKNLDMSNIKSGFAIWSNYPARDVFGRYAEREFKKKARNCINQKQYDKVKADYITKLAMI